MKSVSPASGPQSSPQVLARTDATKKDRLAAAVETVWLVDGELGLTVRRLAVVSETTSQTLYTYWGSREALLGDVTEALAGIVVGWGSLPDRRRWLAAGLDRPAAWKLLVVGYGPGGHGGQNLGVGRARDQALGVVGSEAGLAQLDGLVNAVYHGRLDRDVALVAA